MLLSPFESFNRFSKFRQSRVCELAVGLLTCHTTDDDLPRKMFKERTRIQIAKLTPQMRENLHIIFSRRLSSRSVLTAAEKMFCNITELLYVAKTDIA